MVTNTFNRRDALLEREFAGPASAGTAVYCEPIELGEGTPFHADCESEFAIPALTATQMPASSTLTIGVQHSGDGSTWTSLGTVSTLSGSAGGTESTKIRYRFPTTVQRYVRASLQGATTGNLTGAKFKYYLVF